MSKILDERQVDDELELLHLQERMKISCGRPSASVTRITRQPSTNKPSDDIPPPSSPDAHHHDNHPPPQDSSLTGVFLGDVVERSPNTYKPITAPTKPSATSAPFPEAVHRRASKFALGRQHKTIPVAPTTNNNYNNNNTTTATSTQNIPQKAEDKLSSLIDEENRQALEAMSQEEIAQAQLELLSKLDPKTIHFLKHTRKQKQQQELPVKASAIISEPLPSAPIINSKDTYPCLASPSPVPSQQQQGGGGGGGVKKSLASRVRYTIDGYIVGLATDTEPIASISNDNKQSVVRRDVLRSDEGILPTGYTIGEASLLSRSTVPQQRVLALRLLKAVVLRSHPAGHNINTSTITCECGDDEEVIEKWLKNKLKWEDVWHHVLHEESLVTRLRVAFDDNNLKVVSSASAALAALFTPYTTTSSNDSSSIDCLPWGLGGWPGVPLRHLQRPHAAAPWVAVPLDIHLHHINDEEEGGGGGGRGEKEEELDERQIGKVDPLGGLLNMNLLSRIVYVYLTLQAPGSIDAIIELLLSCAMAGREVCRAVIDTPGMKEVLLHLLITNSRSSRNNNNREKEKEKEEEEEEERGRRKRNRGERCLRTVCLLAQSSPRNCISLFFSDDGEGGDLRRIVLDALLLANNNNNNQQQQQHSSMSGERHTDRIEALRLWRVMAAYNRHLITMDDAFGPLATFFNTTTHGEVMREVYLTASALCHAGVMMSPHCAESILTMAVESLEQQLVDVVGTIGGDQRDDDNKAAAAARYESIAAVLGYIEMYCSKNKQAIPRVVAILDKTCLLGSFVYGIKRTLNESSRGRSRNALACIAMSLCVLQVMSGRTTKPQSLPSSMHHLLDTIITTHALPCCHAMINTLDATLLQPWDLVVINSNLPLIRLALHAAWLTITTNCHKQGEDEDMQELERVKMSITIAATALATLPPGDEQAGLHALSILTHPTAIKYLNEVVKGVYHSEDITSLATPFDVHKEQEVKKTKDDDAMSKTLMTGWAATWLGMVQEEDKQHTTIKTSIPADDVSKEYCTLMLTRLPVPLTLSPQGSSLPLSPDWPVREVPWVPADASSSSSTAAAAAGYALYYTLAMMHHDHTVFSLKQGMNNIAVVKTAIQLVFDCSPGESSSGTIVDTGITSGLWTDELVRWSLYKILQYHPTYLKQQQERKDEWTLPEAQSLVSQYASTSYGDALFGACVALLLRRHVPAPVQLEVLVMLAESRALHLLPSLQDCCTISGYKTSSSSSKLAAADAAAVYLDPPQTQDERGEGENVAYYLKLVEDGTLALCLDRESIAADMIIHRLALKMYTDGTEVSAKRMAMVCAVLRRACREEEEEEGGGNRVVSALVRWDIHEMVASDVVTEERLEYIKEACASQGEVALWKEVVKWSREA